MEGKRDYPPPKSRTLAEILDDLRRPVPPRLIRQKDTGKYKADYIPHTAVRDLLDYYAPGWESQCQLFEAGGRVYVRLTLIVHGSDGHLMRDGLGGEAEDLEGYGDPSSNAHAQALRRAAMEYGLGRDLWRK